MILNKVALLVMVLVQVTFILGSEGATSVATGAPEETTGIIELSILQFMIQKNKQSIKNSINLIQIQSSQSGRKTKPFEEML